MIGVIDADEYTPRLAAVFCHLLRVVFPRLSANTLRTSKYVFVLRGCLWHCENAVVAVWLVLLTLPDVDCGGREGRDSVLLASAIAAANAVFPDTQPALSYDRVRLTGGKGPAYLPCALLLTALSCQTS